MWFRRISLLVLLAAAATLAWWLWLRPPDPSQVYIFDGVRGPKGVSKVAAPKLARIADYERGSPHRLAVLVTDETSGWLGLVRTFKSHGVPITLTRDPERALKHRVIFVCPLISGRALKPQHLRALSAHVRNGGTLLTFNLAGGGLDELFGVTGAVEGRGRSLVNWTTPRGVPEEDQIRISRDGPFSMGSVGYRVTTGKAEATFDDGSAAVVCRQAGGRACVVGVDIGALAGRAMNGRSEAIGRAYSNTYEPSLDVTSLLIGKIARHNGLVVILIHPNLVGEKLAFERRLIDDWRDRAWIGSLAEFGGWWTARDQAEVDVVWRDGRPLLTALAGPAIKDLAIRLPKAPGGGVTMDLRAGERRTIPIG